MTISLLKNKIFKNQKKIAIFLVIIFGLVLIGIKIFSTKVSAQIVPILVHEEHLSFGTVFPGEELQGNFGVHFVTEFKEAGINYQIIFKRKPLPGGYQGEGDPEMPGYYRNLCPSLTPIKVVEGEENDNPSLAYVGDNDLSDDWIIYFKVPAIMGNVAQEHIGGIVTTDGDYGCDVSIDIDIEDLCDPTQNLVLNGSFEVPEVTHTAKWEIFASGTTGLEWIVEWESTQTSYGGYTRPDPALTEYHEGVLGNAQDGDQYTELDSDWFGPDHSLSGEPALTKIYQNIATLPGIQYNLHYWYSPRPNVAAANNVLKVRVDNSEVASHQADGGATTSWTEYTYSFVATGNTTKIEFAGAGAADSLGTFLDNVSLMCQLPQ